jgi:hypothetical protein
MRQNNAIRHRAKARFRNKGDVIDVQGSMRFLDLQHRDEASHCAIHAGPIIAGSLRRLRNSTERMN